MKTILCADRSRIIDAIRAAPDGYVVEIKPRTRSLEQNARMWAMLAEIAQQVEWYGQRLTKEEWKCVFSASLKQQKVVPGLDTGFVVMAQSTSSMTVSDMSDMIELITSFGVSHDVKFRDHRDLEDYP